MGKKSVSYALEFKRYLVKLVELGRGPSELSKECGCHASTISGWVHQSQADKLGCGKPDFPLTTQERKELAALPVFFTKVVRFLDFNLAVYCRIIFYVVGLARLL